MSLPSSLGIKNDTLVMQADEADSISFVQLYNVRRIVRRGKFFTVFGPDGNSVGRVEIPDGECITTAQDILIKAIVDSKSRNIRLVRV